MGPKSFLGPYTHNRVQNQRTFGQASNRAFLVHIRRSAYIPTPNQNPQSYSIQHHQVHVIEIQDQCSMYPAVSIQTNQLKMDQIGDFLSK